MTSKEKAEELVDRYQSSPLFYSLRNAKICALIAVDEILDVTPIKPSPNPAETLDECVHQAKVFWNKVITEIEKL